MEFEKLQYNQPVNMLSEEKDNAFFDKKLSSLAG